MSLLSADLRGSFKKFLFSQWKRRFRKMFLLRSQAITSCKTIISIADICLLFSLQVKSSIVVRGVWNSKNGQNRSSSNNKVSAKKKKTHDTWRYLGFGLLQDPPNLTDSAPSDFYLFPTLKSHLRGRQFGHNPCCRGVRGKGWQAATVFREGIAMHEHRLTKYMYINVKGGGGGLC